MADLTKLKRRNTLGAPPPLAEASQNLQAPETAPRPVAVSPPEPEAFEEEPRQPPRQHRLYDARTMRKTGRIVQFATRVSWDFDDKLRRIARRDGLKLVEVLELALEAYEAARK